MESIKKYFTNTNTTDACCAGPPTEAILKENHRKNLVVR
jgi:hypothetical protein